MRRQLWSQRREANAPSPYLYQLAEALFNEAARLRETQVATDVDALRSALIARVNDVQQQAYGAGIAHAHWEMARYALCALLDEAIGDTPWGGGVWAKNSLLLHFYAESHGGVRFFTLLAQAEAEPEAYRPVLVVFYLCLALGLEGQYRLQADGEARLAEIRSRLYPHLNTEPCPGAKRQGGARFPALSGWRGMLRVGVAVALTAGLAAAWSSLSFAFEQQHQRLRETISATGTTSWMPQLAAALAADIRSGMIQLEAQGEGLRLILSSGAFFASGSAELSAGQQRTLQRLAGTIQHLPVRLHIVGHSDNVSAGSKWPGNDALSLARARAVVQALMSETDAPRLTISAEGRGDREPLVDNNNADNRARNRRVEIFITPL